MTSFSSWVHAGFTWLDSWPLWAVLAFFVGVYVLLEIVSLALD